MVLAIKRIHCAGIAAALINGAARGIPTMPRKEDIMDKAITGGTSGNTNKLLTMASIETSPK